MNNTITQMNLKPLGFGAMRLPENNGVIDIEQVKSMVDDFIKAGFTYFDTAYGYHSGNSQIALREAVSKRYPREAFQMANKMPPWNVKCPDDFARIFAEQQEKCGVEYFDFYLLHSLDREIGEKMETMGGFDYLKQLKADGRAKHIGFSFHDSAEALELLLSRHPEVEFVQLQINYADWENEYVQARACHEVALKYGKQIIVMEPVKGGELANPIPAVRDLLTAFAPDASPASWAIRYAASQQNVFMVLSGMSTPEQVADNTAYMADFKPLCEKENEILREVVKVMSEVATIPCTGCKYCVDGCPQKINIPKLFSVYNAEEKFGANPAHQKQYAHHTKEAGKASDCIACGACEGICPQHLPIIELMKGVAARFEK